MRDVTASATQDVAVGGRTEAGFDTPVLPYIPGSTVRGALAAAWIRDHGRPVIGNPLRAEFIDLFESRVRYGPLMQRGSMLVPLSAAFCKYPITDACRDWSADAAVDDDAARCPGCGQRAATGKGEIVGVRTRHVLRTRLDENGVALDGNLYGRHALAGSTTYHGRVFGSHPWLDEPHDIWMGGRITTSGHATVSVGPDMPHPAVPASPRADGALVVRFLAPAVVVDGAGRPSLDPTDEILRVLGLPGAVVGEPRHWIRPVQVAGWHTASNLPKPTETAITMGSVTVIDLAEPAGQDRLDRLVTNGIGLRRAEGFGVVEVNPPAWRRAPAAGTPAATASVSVLEPLRQVALLDDATVVSWLLDRCRDLAVHRARGVPVRIDALMTQRVPGYFDNNQADAVRGLLESADLSAAITLLDHLLERLAVQGATA